MIRLNGKVQDTMAWINTVDTINVPSLVCGVARKEVLQDRKLLILRVEGQVSK